MRRRPPTRRRLTRDPSLALSTLDAPLPTQGWRSKKRPTSPKNTKEIKTGNNPHPELVEGRRATNKPTTSLTTHLRGAAKRRLEGWPRQTPRLFFPVEKPTAIGELRLIVRLPPSIRFARPSANRAVAIFCLRQN